MNDYIYAPVVIPTLNRYEHLKKCLESLSLCTGAKFTDVFVGLDYPVKESHWDGYNKINEYLEKNTFNFKSLSIIKRKYNYGFGPNGNLNTLINDTFKIYDRIIISEDDNIFSPCFLEFINKGLSIFKEDKSVLAINGYRHDYPIKFNKNTFFRQNVNFSAWGFGFWRDRSRNLPPTDYFKKRFSLKEFFKIKKDIGANRAFDYANFFFTPPPEWIDSSLSVYAYLENKNVIMPSQISLVRNIGWDASGEHCKATHKLSDKHLKQITSYDKNFNYIGNGFEYYQENREILKKNSYARVSEIVFWKRFLKVLFLYTLKKIFKKNT